MGRGESSAPELRKGRSIIDSRLQTNRRRQTHMSGVGVLAGHVDHACTLQKQWDGLALARQQAIVKAVIDHVIINPAMQRDRQSPDRLRVDPR